MATLLDLFGVRRQKRLGNNALIAPTHRISPSNGIRLLPEAEVLLPREDLVDELPVEHGDLGPEGLQLLQQHGGALLDLPPRQVRRALCRARDHVREAYAEV